MPRDRIAALSWPLALLIGSLLVFVLVPRHTLSYIASDGLLAYELSAPDGQPADTRAGKAHEWTIRNDPPFSYRLLFPAVVLGTWQLTRNAPADDAQFLFVYRLWSGIFYCAAILSMLALLRAAGFSRNAAGCGALLTLMLPAMSLAYTHPVHSHEDPLAYTLLNLGVIAMLKQRYWLLMALTLVGVCCRETLLVLPAVFLLDRRCPFLQRLTTAALGIGLFVAIHWAVGVKNYDALGIGLFYNLGRSANSAAFLFLCYGFMWMLAAAALWRGAQGGGAPRALMFRTAPLAALLIVGTTITVGRIEEIRLLQLLAPWVVVLTLDLLCEPNQPMLAYIRQWRWWQALGIGGLLALAVGLPRLIERWEGGAYFLPRYWWAVLFAMLFVTCALLPFVKRALMPAHASRTEPRAPSASSA